jgi:hypothetical protein
MVPLLIGASWLLAVSLVLGLCAAARDEDLQQDPSRSAAVRAPVRPDCGTITRETHVEHATADDARIGMAPTSGRFTAVSG